MRLRKKSVMLLIALGFASTYLTFYATIAHNVAYNVYDLDGTAVWRSAPSGSFFPWPREPGMLMILSGMNEVDLFIYTYLIKPRALAAVTILLWVGWFLYLLNLFGRFQSSKKRDRTSKAGREESKEEKEAIDLQELRKKFEIPPPG